MLRLRFGFLARATDGVRPLLSGLSLPIPKRFFMSDPNRKIVGSDAAGHFQNVRDDVARKLFSLEFASRRESQKVEVKEMMEKLQWKAFDTGSPEVQIGVLTVKIRNYTEHLKTNKKDHSCKRALQLTLATRRKQMKYLRKTNPGRYEAVLKKLQIRPLVDRKYPL
eukprot:m.1984 g.1984  ORF g.1984 m.1984 type:complete len:166 (+) comp8133_c0_seq1:83-580(+)